MTLRKSTNVVTLFLASTFLSSSVALAAPLPPVAPDPTVTATPTATIPYYGVKCSYTICEFPFDSNGKCTNPTVPPVTVCDVPLQFSYPTCCNKPEGKKHECCDAIKAPFDICAAVVNGQPYPPKSCLALRISVKTEIDNGLDCSSGRLPPRASSPSQPTRAMNSSQSSSASDLVEGMACCPGCDNPIPVPVVAEQTVSAN